MEGISDEFISTPSALNPHDSGVSRIKIRAIKENPRPPMKAIIHKDSRQPKILISPAKKRGERENPRLTNIFLIPPTRPLFLTNHSKRTFLEQLVRTPCPKNLTPK